MISLGHRKQSAPRHGSLAYLPRKRAKVVKGKIKKWPEATETGFLGFAGFKAGMTHIAFIDKNPHSVYKDQEIFCPVTILEAPPLLMYGLRVYHKSVYGLKATRDVLAENVVQNVYLARKINLPTEINFEQSMQDLDDYIAKEKNVEIRALFASQPHLSSLSRKKPDLFEIKIGGKNIDDILEFGKKYLGKEVRAFDVFKVGQVVDASAVSKGKGFEGPVMRFGTHRVQHKSRKGFRKVGCLGAETPARIMWTVSRAGQRGFHQRVEVNKPIMKISEKGEEINPKGGFVNYGLVKGDYIMIKGSVPGAKKRLVRLRASIRQAHAEMPPEITYVSVASQQFK